MIGNPLINLMSAKGPYLYDFCTEGEGGEVVQNVTIVLIGCVNGTVTRGRCPKV